MAQRPLVDQGFIEKLERLTIHWKQSFPGLIGGHNSSRFSGGGQEFLDHRHFHYGDDLRAINWRAFLRLEKLILKMFQVEPRVPVRLLVDTSLSMSTGAGVSKFDYACKLAASLCYVGLVRLDTICLQPFSQALGEPFVCGGGRHRFVPAVQFLSRLQVGGVTDYLSTARKFAENYPQRGLAIIISDFLDDAEIDKPLQYLAESGHELLLVHLWTPEDREPPWEGEMELVDTETGQRLDLTLDRDARQAYTAAFDEYARQLETAVSRHGGRYVGLPTTAGLDEAIFGSLMRAGAVQ